MKGCLPRRAGLRCLFYLVVGVAAALAGGAAQAGETLRIGGAGAALGAIHRLGEEFTRDHPEVEVKVLPYIGSTGAIQGVAGGQLGLGVTARPARGDEQRLPVRLQPYAVTPFVIGVHPDVPVTELSRRQLVEIYAGRLTHWEDGRPLRVILRLPRETDNDVLREMGPEMEAALASALQRPGMRRAATDQDMADILERTPGAVGPTTLGLLVSEHRRVKVLAVDGVVPSLDTLRDGSYPLFKRLYLVLPDAPSPAVAAFVAFLQSARGQAILRDNAQQPLVRGSAR